MAGKIAEDILENILSRVDIVELISGYLPLKKAGRNFRANCPFHHEKTPSFMVSPDKQIYHCFGCGESGNAFKFLMRHERMEFPEAVELLAKKTGIVLPQTNSHDGSGLSSSIYRVNEAAAVYFENILNSPPGSCAKEYFFKRGLTPKTIKEFRLGFCGSSGDGLIRHLRSQDFNLALIEKSGLSLPREGGGYNDRFRNRLIFPIFDIRCRPLGFGARVLDKALPKYVNSPETPIYSKGKNLYGFNLSKDAIREADSAVIVEGYLDFIIPYQNGLKNIVASQGTALTVEQARLLKRFTTNAVMIYDGDAAGELAALRNLEILIEEGLNVKIVSLPKGFDPDLYVRKEGIAGLKGMIAAAQNLFDYKLGVLKTRHDIEDACGKSLIAAEMLLTISKFQNAIIRGEYIKRLSESLKVRESYIIEELGKVKLQGSRVFPGQQLEGKKEIQINPEEKLLIRFMLEEGELIERIKQELEPADFYDLRSSKIVSMIYELAGRGKHVGANILMDHFSDDQAKQLLCESLFMPEFSSQDREKAICDCIRRLKHRKIRAKRELLHEQIKSAQSLGDDQKLNALMQEFHELIKKGQAR